MEESVSSCSRLRPSDFLPRRPTLVLVVSQPSDFAEEVRLHSSERDVEEMRDDGVGLRARREERSAKVDGKEGREWKLVELQEGLKTHSDFVLN